MVVITIVGRIPSKKNGKQIVCFGKVPRVLPSKAYQEWHKVASKQIADIDFIPSQSKIKFVLYAPDKRKADLSNKWQSVEDLLVDNKKLEDDNWFILPDIHMKFGGVDTENPRIEIYVQQN